MLDKRCFPKLKEMNWEEIWGFPFKILVSLQDKLIQFKTIHRMYYTPYKLHRISPLKSQNCWRCCNIPGDFIHIFWSCPNIVIFWTRVINAIAIVMSVVLEQEVGTYLLGLMGNNIATTIEKGTQISSLLFYARKVIVLNWKKQRLPQ